MKRDILDGKWKVVCLGWAKVFNQLDDHKLIKQGRGHNELPTERGLYKLGWFFVEEGGDCIVLNYDHPANPFPARFVRDRMQQVGDKWIGVLEYAGKEMFRFELHPVVQEAK